MEYLTDTTFLIDMWRERIRGGPATNFAVAHGLDTFSVPWVAKGEFLRGAVCAGTDQERVCAFLQNFRTVFPTEATLLAYAHLYSILRRENKLIGPHDLWIAACGLDIGAPLLTRNADEFERVPNLQVIDYSA